MITSSVDRSIKVWDLNYIFENDHHIDKHELTIDSVSVSTTVGLAVTVTRSCVGVWDYMTGRLLHTLAQTLKSPDSANGKNGIVLRMQKIERIFKKDILS